MVVARTAEQVEAVAAGDRGGRRIGARRGGSTWPRRVPSRGWWSRTIDRFGRLDLVMANAGIVSPDSRSGLDADFAAVLDVNLLSVHSLARAAEGPLWPSGAASSS